MPESTAVAVAAAADVTTRVLLLLASISPGESS